MFAVNTYEEIEKKERELNERHIVVLLFVRPSLPGAKEIIDEFNYLHYNSQRYCSIYAVGYMNSDGSARYSDCRKVQGIDNTDWYYSDQAFIEFKNQLERRLKWRYSGEIELIVLQSNTGGGQVLNFQNYIAVDVNYGLRQEYIDSFPRFMESLIRSSQSEVEARVAVCQIQGRHLKIGNIVESAVNSSQKIPGPVRQIIRDRLFYRTSKSY